MDVWGNSGESVVDNLGGSSFTGHLGDGVNSGCADNLGDNMASLNGSDNWFDDGNISAMFGFDFSAGSLDGLDNGLGDGVSDGSRGNSGMSIGSNASMSKGKTSIVLRISFSLGFTFDDESGGGKRGKGGSNMSSAVFVDDLFASLLVGDFFTGNISGGADVFSSRSTRLDFNFLSFGYACYWLVCSNSSCGTIGQRKLRLR